MSWIATVGKWVVTNLPTVLKVVKKVAGFVHKAAEAADALLEGRHVIAQTDNPKPQKSKRKSAYVERPDIMSVAKKSSSQIVDLVKRIDENKKTLRSANESNEVDHRRLLLQIDIMELIVSSQTFERFTSNINLHAANLHIHLQTIQNTAGLLDDVNRQRKGIKACIGTVNHLINVLGVGNRVDKIENIDLDMHKGQISIKGAFEAFENTKELLVKEIDAFTESVSSQLEKADRVRNAAIAIPDAEKRISIWLDDSVEPKLLDAKKEAESLRRELSALPKLEANVRRVLESPKEDDFYK